MHTVGSIFVPYVLVIARISILRLYCYVIIIVIIIITWYSSTIPKPLCRNEEVQAYWDVPVCGELQGVRANLVDACIMNHKTKQVVTFQLSCPWIGNREKKSGEKTMKYS